MLARRNLDRLKREVGSPNLHRMAIDRRSPGRIIGLGEDQYRRRLRISPDEIFVSARFDHFNLN